MRERPTLPSFTDLLLGCQIIVRAPKHLIDPDRSLSSGCLVGLGLRDRDRKDGFSADGIDSSIPLDASNSFQDSVGSL